nr:MAG TPA: hypothetical protein [Caudoviricetes sp.]
MGAAVEIVRAEATEVVLAAVPPLAGRVVGYAGNCNVVPLFVTADPPTVADWTAAFHVVRSAAVMWTVVSVV